MMIELTTMCAVVHDDRILLINRRKNWTGWALPGGHLEYGESITECIVREMLEETGILVSDLNYKGLTHFYNPETHFRHLVFNYYTEKYTGELKKYCDEGELKWFLFEEIQDLDLAEGMKYRFPLFKKETEPQELYIEWTEREGYRKVLYKGL